MKHIMLRNAPNSWKVRRLGQLFRERKEKVSDKEYPPLSVTMQGVIPQIETAAKTDDGDNRKCVREGDYVINSRSDRKGSGGLSNLEGSVSLINIVLEPRNIWPRYAHHLLRSPAFQEEFYRWGHGIVADLWTTRYSEMKNIRLAIPDIDTQKAIADFLDRETARIDQLIEKKQRLVGALNEKLDAVIHGHVNSLSSTKAQPLHRFCHIVTGKTPSRADEGNFDPDEGLPWATPANLGFFEPILTTKEKLTEDGAKGQVVVGSGTVLINGIGASIGKVGFAGRKMTFNQQVHGIIQVRRLLTDRFLFFVMYTKKDEIVSLASNTTIPIINADRFGRVAVPLPPKDLQADAVREIEVSIGRTRKLTDAISKSIDRLREFRSALITAAVTGQINVTSWDGQGQTDRRLDQIEEDMAVREAPV